MNRENVYFNEKKSFLSSKLFEYAQHSSLTLKSSSLSECSNVDLIKNHQSAIPAIIVKHLNKAKDPVKEFIKIKLKYSHDKTALESRLVRLYKLNKISRESNVSKINIVKYITHKYLDPAPYADKNQGFLFYPQHGTLKCFENGKNKFLVHAENSDAIRFDKISSKMRLKKLNCTASKLSHPTELIASRNSDFGIVRCRNRVNIAKIPEPDSIEDGCIVKFYDKYDHKNDILASSLNDCRLSTIDSKLILRQYNLEHRYEDVNLKLSDYYIEDNLVPVSLSSPVSRHAKKDLIYFSTKQHFGIIDCRNKHKIALDHSYTPKNQVFKCEKIFSHSASLLHPDLVYIASSHIFYAFDYRKLKEPVVYWPHQLYKPPIMLATTNFDANEVICLSSCMPGDLKIFNHDYHNSFNFYPYKPSSIEKTYQNLREQGLFLLSDEIKERVDASVTGIALSANVKQSYVKLFTENCFGDIFENKFSCLDSKKDFYDQDAAKDRFQQWENFLNVSLDPNKELTARERIQNEALIIDDVVRLQSIPKFLNGTDTIETLDLVDLEAGNSLTSKPKWKNSIKDARNCVDLLAREIMNLWDDVNDSEEEKVVNYGENSEENDKVAMWLESNNEPANDSMITDVDVDEELSSQEVPTLSNESFSKRRSRVAGF